MSERVWYFGYFAIGRDGEVYCKYPANRAASQKWFEKQKWAWESRPYRIQGVSKEVYNQTETRH